MDVSPRLTQLRLPFSGQAARALRLAVCIVAGLALALGAVGCRSNAVDQAYVQTLHSEIRMLEDEIYAIESEYEKTLALLEACEGRLAADERTDTTIRRSGDNPLRSVPSILEPKRSDRQPVSEELLPPALHGKEEELPTGSSLTTPPLLEGPMIDLGEPGESFGDIEQQGYEEPIDLPASARVTHIVLNPRLTGGLDFNGSPGDDGIYVVVEPRNQDDDFVPLPGEMSLVLLDPHEEGETARVARWNLPRDEVRRRLKTDEPTAPGIHLKLPWNALPPSHEDLLLFVRYKTADGRQVEAQAAMTLAVSAKSSTRWTPRSPEASGARTSPEGSPPPHLTQADLPQPASVPTIADLRKNDSQPTWAPPKNYVAPAGAEMPVGPQDAPKSTAQAPAWKPYR